MKKFGKSGGGAGGMKTSGKASAKNGKSGGKLFATPSNVGKCAK